jgi:hypothetical protein
VLTGSAAAALLAALYASLPGIRGLFFGGGGGRGKKGAAYGLSI